VESYIAAKKEVYGKYLEGDAFVIAIKSGFRFTHIVVRMMDTDDDLRLHTKIELPIFVNRDEFGYVTRALAELNQELSENEAFTLGFMDGTVRFECLIDVPETGAALDDKLAGILDDKITPYAEDIMRIISSAHSMNRRARMEKHDEDDALDMDDVPFEKKGILERFLETLGLISSPDDE